MAETQIVYGFHAVISRLRRRAADIVEIYLDSLRKDGRARDLGKLAGTHGVRIISVDTQRLDGLTGHAAHQGVAVTRVAPTAVEHALT